MPLLNRLQDDVKQAMREKKDLVRDTLRMVVSELKNRRIELGKDLTEEDELAVLARCVKTRKDSAEQYNKAKRPELEAKELAEIGVIESYLPKQLSPDEARAAVKSAIDESGAKSMKDMGLVMKALMAKHKGLIDGKTAQDLVKELLG